MQKAITNLERNNYNTNYKTKHAKKQESNQQRTGFITQLVT